MIMIQHRYIHLKTMMISSASLMPSLQIFIITDNQWGIQLSLVNLDQAIIFIQQTVAFFSHGLEVDYTVYLLQKSTNMVFM